MRPHVTYDVPKHKGDHGLLDLEDEGIGFLPTVRGQLSGDAESEEGNPVPCHSPLPELTNICPHNFLVVASDDFSELQSG